MVCHQALLINNNEELFAYYLLVASMSVYQLQFQFKPKMEKTRMDWTSKH